MLNLKKNVVHICPAQDNNTYTLQLPGNLPPLISFAFIFNFSVVCWNHICFGISCVSCEAYTGRHDQDGSSPFATREFVESSVSFPYQNSIVWLV